MHVWGEQWSLATLRIVDLETRKVSNLISDRHLMDFSWSPDGTRVAYASSRTPELENGFLEDLTISTIDADLSHLTSRKDVCALPKAHDIDLTWANDGKLYVCSSVPAGKMLAGHGVYSIDPDSHSSSYEHLDFGIEYDAVSLTKASNGEVLGKVEHRLESRICSLGGKVLYGQQQEIEAFDAVYPNEEDIPSLQSRHLTSITQWKCLRRTMEVSRWYNCLTIERH